MPDFSSLLQSGWDDVKRAPPLPIGTYFGTITKYEFGESSKKQTPFVRYTVNLSEAGEDVDPDDLVGVELHKKIISTEYYLSDKALIMLKDFLESCGIDLAGKSRNETIPEAMGHDVQVQLIHEPNDQDPESPYVKIKRMAGRAD